MFSQRVFQRTVIRCQRSRGGALAFNGNPLSVSASHLVHLGATPQKYESRPIKDQYLDELQEYKTIHCRDRIRGCNIASSVHVTLEEVDVGVFLGQGLKGRRDHMAWTTPIPD